MQQKKINIICVGVQRSATTSIYEDIINSIGLNKNQIKEKGSLFNSNNLPSGMYLKKPIKREKKDRYWVDFTPEYCLYLNEIKIPKQSFSFIIFRKPSTRIISHWQKYNNEVKKINFDDFLSKNIDDCVKRSTYSLFLPDIIRLKIKIYFLSGDREALYDDLSTYIGLKIKYDNVKKNSAIVLPKHLNFIFKIYSRRLKFLHPLLQILGAKFFFRNYMRKNYSSKLIPTINNDNIKFLEELDYQQKLIFISNNIDPGWN